MGQYWKPVCVDRNESIHPHSYGEGLKLMEHSWKQAPVMRVVCKLLMPNQPWHKTRLLWVGDYADGYEILYQESKEIKPEVIPSTLPENYFLVNHTKKEFVDMSKCPTDTDNWTIHPLSLLTAVSNGMGGGDYKGDEKYIGYWVGDQISVEVEKPVNCNEIRPNFKEI
jgi:hypothetical protein